MEFTKKRIISIVRNWKKLFPKEYEASVLFNKIRVENRGTDWGEFDKGNSALGREILCWPETLTAAFNAKLTMEEQKWLFSDPKSTVWMQRTFPEFVPNKKRE